MRECRREFMGERERVRVSVCVREIKSVRESEFERASVGESL